MGVVNLSVFSAPEYHTSMISGANVCTTGKIFTSQRKDLRLSVAEEIYHGEENGAKYLSAAEKRFTARQKFFAVFGSV